MFAWIWPKLDREGRIGATPMRQDSPSRITHVLVETRLVGRVQLIIVERPTSDEAAAQGTAAEGQ